MALPCASAAGPAAFGEVTLTAPVAYLTGTINVDGDNGPPPCFCCIEWWQSAPFSECTWDPATGTGACGNCRYFVKGKCVEVSFEYMQTYYI
jgi:hypothetical protein